jgi:glycosyltransferase involved in cell wall biosynthesis
MSNYLSELILAIKLANYKRLRKRKEPQRIAYQQWVAKHDTINDERRQTLAADHASLPRKPLISVIMPVYNAPLTWLDAAIESVQRQIYQEWELCIADDCSTDAAIRPYLESKSKEDARIKVDFRTRNGHISAASNSAIALASGEFLALMDQDDLIPEQALLAVACCINEYPDAKIIYSDEDKINEHGQRESPARKPGWHRSSLLECNRVSHLAVYQTSLVAAVGGFRVGYEGAQDHDLVLRCSEQILDHQIIHIPEILYHWRIHENSTAHTRRAKPYAMEARKKVLQDHHVRTSRTKT